jgi:hypothetical protein
MSWTSKNGETAHSCVTHHHLAVVPQSSAKYQFYFTVYYITLNPKCLAQRASKNLKKKYPKKWLEDKKNKQVIWVLNITI